MTVKELKKALDVTRVGRGGEEITAVCKKTLREENRKRLGEGIIFKWVDGWPLA